MYPGDKRVNGLSWLVGATKEPTMFWFFCRPHQHASSKASSCADPSRFKAVGRGIGLLRSDAVFTLAWLPFLPPQVS